MQMTPERPGSMSSFSKAVLMIQEVNNHPRLKDNSSSRRRPVCDGNS